MAEKEEEKKKVGRPRKTPRSNEEEYNETSVEKLEMAKKDKSTGGIGNSSNIITIDDLSSKWAHLFPQVLTLNDAMFKRSKKDTGSAPTIRKWNELNPFLQTDRIKKLSSTPSQYSKAELHKFLDDPGSYEKQLRSASWSSSIHQQIYYNILRRACDIPCYNYYVVPDLLEKTSEYKSESFKNEDRLVNEWFEVFNVPTSLKTIALQVKREGKQSYILRNKIEGTGKQRRVDFAVLEKLPTDWIKITGIGQLGFTVSFNFMYFMHDGNNPAYFGKYIEDVWNEMINKGVVTQESKGKPMAFNVDNAMKFSYSYNQEKMDIMIESMYDNMTGKSKNYMFWVKLPFDICYTFCSDMSHSWVCPDTIATLEKLQELTDYGKLAGLIASTPLTAILTGEAEYVEGARAGKTETKISPEVLKGLQDTFNAVTSTNVEAFFYPLKNVKLQQLATDVNSSEIISAATENFVEVSGEGGLTITTDKPNISQIKTAQLLAASQQRYVTLQFERVLNYIIQHKLGLQHKWSVKIWGDIFSLEGEKKYLKEIVANGNIALLPKLMSAEGLSIRDTKALAEYIKSLDFYKDFQTYTMEKSNELKDKGDETQGTQEKKSVGRPGLSDDEVENDATGASKEAGTNTVDNRDKL